MEVYPKREYWRDGWDSEDFYYCRLLGVCLGGEETQNHSGVCEKGYKGRLCTVCEVNYARLGKYRCSECHESIALYYVAIVVYILCLLFFALFILRGNIRDAARESPAYAGVLLRIMTNHA